MRKEWEFTGEDVQKACDIAAERCAGCPQCGLRHAES